MTPATTLPIPQAVFVEPPTSQFDVALRRLAEGKWWTHRRGSQRSPARFRSA